MKKGIVMEINERFITILTPEGEFLRANKLNRDYQIGQEIDFFPAGQEEQKKSLAIPRLFKGKTVAILIACLLLLVSFIPFYQNNQVYAYVSIDINPSVELVLNKDYKVIELIPYNKDGKKIVKQLRGWKRKEIDEVTKAIIAEIERQGYLKNHHEIVVGMVYKAASMPIDDPQWKGKWADVQEVIQEEHLDLTVVQGTTEDREKAQDKGVTIGEYKEALVKVNKKQSTNKQNQMEKQIGGNQPKDEPPSEGIVQEEAEAPQKIHSTVVSPKDKTVEPAIDSKPLSPPGQAKRDSNLDDPAWDDKEKGLDRAHPSEKEKKTEHIENNAEKTKQQNNSNNKSNGNNNNSNRGNDKSNGNNNNSNRGNDKSNGNNNSNNGNDKSNGNNNNSNRGNDKSNGNNNNNNNGNNNNQGKQKDNQHNETN